MISALKNYIITLNLFRPLEVAEVEDDHQRRSNIIATRIFLILLFVSLLGLILAITLNLQTINVTISHPTQEQYESLPNPTCSCSQSSLSYDQFFSSQPSFHQVCSSQFVSDDWIEANPVDALFASTLECYYEQSCMDTIALYLPPYINSTNFTLLNASRNQPNEPIGRIVSRMFVDSWLSNISFSSYYQACSPASCTYQYTRQRSILSYVTIIISVFGGLTTSLKIIISILLRIALKIRTNQSFYDHCRTIKNWFLTFNIKQYIVSRLHDILLIIILVALCFTLASTFQTQIVQISKPSLATYEDLLGKYSATLQCPCSAVSIQYNSFINIFSINYHQVCSSDFVTDRWIAALYGNGTSTRYAPLNYQFIAIGQFRFLTSLCQLTQKNF
jgi:hypothetical protein